MNPLNCKEVTVRSALADTGALSWTERATIRFHMAICWVCRRYQRQVKMIRESLRFSIQQKLSVQDIPALKARMVQNALHKP